MKQTSIEWLIYQISILNTEVFNELKEEFEQAKEMHKQEIIHAWMASDNELQRIAAEQYYQETYGGNK